MKEKILSATLLLAAFCANAQQLLLLDRFNGNKIVNDSTITVFSSDLNSTELTQYFTIKNNTDKPLAMFLRKTVNMMADSTTDYFCFYIKCWPDTDTTNIADTIQPGAEDYNFASHVCHVRRLDHPPLQPGISSVTYTIFDNTTFPEPVEATVTVIYHLGGLGMDEHRQAAAAVYPNPASEWVTVRTGEKSTGDCQLILYNSLGNLVHKSSVRLEGNELTIPVSRFHPGFYYGRLVPEQGPEVAFRFQIAR